MPRLAARAVRFNPFSAPPLPLLSLRRQRGKKTESFIMFLRSPSLFQPVGGPFEKSSSFCLFASALPVCGAPFLLADLRPKIKKAPKIVPSSRFFRSCFARKGTRICGVYKRGSAENRLGSVARASGGSSHVMESRQGTLPVPGPGWPRKIERDGDDDLSRKKG